jgi:two-component sensor histidine kinase
MRPATSNGRVRVEWGSADGSNVPRAELHRRETSGPQVNAPKGSNGFGSTLIEKVFAARLCGTATLRFERDRVSCTLDLVNGNFGGGDGAPTGPVAFK